MSAKSASIISSVRSFLLREPIYSGLIPPDLNEDHALVESGALDSIGIFSLVSFLEKTFSISVSPQDLTEANFRSLRTIANFVETSAK